MRKSIFVMTAAVAMMLFGCKENPYIDAPGENSHNLDSIPVAADPRPTPDPEGIDIPEDAISVYEAVKIASKLQSGDVTDEVFYIKGWVDSFSEKEHAKSDFEDKFARYGNDYVYISAVNDGSSTKLFYLYRVVGKGGEKLPDHDCIHVGDFVVVQCAITNYNDIYESNGSCTIEVSTNEHFNEVFN